MVAPLPYNFHDAALASIRVGPRREVTLTVALDLPGRLGDHIAHIRFGGIDNFEEVRAFFGNLPPRPSTRAFIDRIAQLDYAKTEVSRPKKQVFRLELEAHGAITIHCRNVAARQDDSAPAYTGAHPRE